MGAVRGISMSPLVIPPQLGWVRWSSSRRSCKCGREPPVLHAGLAGTGRPIVADARGSGEDSGTRKVNSDNEWVTSPWALLGRTVKEHDITRRWGQEEHELIAARSVASETGVPEDIVLQRIQQLRILLPDLYSHRSISQLKPALLARLALNPSELMQRIAVLKDMLPRANISIMVSRRPALAADDNLEDAKEALAQLKEMLPTLDVEQLVEDHPHYLVQDIDALREQLARLFPTGDPAKIISRNPDIVLQLECNTKKNQPLG